MIVLIRHAHTEMAGRFCGHRDPPLSARGVAQLEELKARVDRYEFTHIYSSDLRRARQTAECLASHGQLPVRILDSLREIAFGDWEGLTWDQIMVRDPVYAQFWLDSYPMLSAPNGEEFADFARRIRHAMDSIAEEVQDDCAAVVTHGGVIRTFLANCAVSTKALDLSACDYGSCWEVHRQAGQWLLGAHIARRQVSRDMETRQ